MKTNKHTHEPRLDELTTTLELAEKMLAVFCAERGAQMAVTMAAMNKDGKAVAHTKLFGYDGDAISRKANDVVFSSTVMLDTLCKKLKDVVELIEISEDLAKERGLGLSIRDKFIFDCQKAVEKTGIFELRVKEGGSK